MLRPRIGRRERRITDKRGQNGMKRFFAPLLLIVALAACMAGCAPRAETAPPTPTPAPTPAPSVIPLPTSTPIPPDYDEPVDFIGQPALAAAVMYALGTDDPAITYRMLDAVDTLILTDAAITDLLPLARANSLKTLVIVDGMMDLSPLSALPALRSLTVTGGRFGDLNAVAVLPQLAELNLFGYETTDFSPLLSMERLTTLRICNHAPCDLSALASLTQLTTLMLPDARGNDLGWLEALTELRDLTIWQCKQRYFDFLPALTKLTHLRLDMRTDCDLTPIGSLHDLHSLTIDMESGRAMDDQSWLSGLRELRELSLRGLYFSDLTRLTGLTKLQSLTLDGIHDNVRLYELPELPALTELSILNNSVVSAGELVRYPALRKLTLYNSPVADASNVYQLTNLTSLTMRADVDGGERRLGGVERVSGMKNLAYLDWGGLGGDLDALADLPKLTHLRLSNARIVDWTPITRLSQLRFLDLSANRIKRVPPSVADMTDLTTLDLSGCASLRSVSALATAPALTRLALNGRRIIDMDSLASIPGLLSLTLVDGGRTDPLTGRRTGAIAIDPAYLEALRKASPCLNYAEDAAVIDRFFLKDYMHAPYACSAQWYPAYDPAP